MSETKTRVHVTLEDFLRVTIADRETFDSIDSASAELGMTTASFKQRLITSRKRYPSLYEGTEPYTKRKLPNCLRHFSVIGTRARTRTWGVTVSDRIHIADHHSRYVRGNMDSM